PGRFPHNLPVVGSSPTRPTRTRPKNMPATCGHSEVRGSAPRADQDPPLPGRLPIYPGTVFAKSRLCCYGERHRFERRVNAQLRHDVLKVSPDGVDREVQLVRYRLTAPGSLGEAHQDFPFPGREGGKQAPVLLSSLLLLQQQAYHVALLIPGQPDLSPGDPTDHLQQMLKGLILAHPGG